ncbi:MAG TPA: class II aldolase/adducin family protein [Acidimicrobiales bacterium]|nr:class II aldolase/adducin family protein [Acidimicrobiales bacterium]
MNGGEDERAGGAAVWSPSVMPPLGAQLSPSQELACAFRHLADVGFSENMAGHITWQLPGETDMLVNPWGLWWGEISASDVCVVDEDAGIVAGRWDVTPAIHLHTELHRRRPDARVVIHNHPYHVSVMAALGVLPDLVHQTGSLFLDDLCLVDEYDGEVDSSALAAELAGQIGPSKVAILSSHGVVVTGSGIVDATYRAASVDRMCHLAYDVLRTGIEPLRMQRAAMAGMKRSLIERAADAYWGGAVRSVLRDHPDVLD